MAGGPTDPFLRADVYFEPSRGLQRFIGVLAPINSSTEPFSDAAGVAVLVCTSSLSLLSCVRSAVSSKVWWEVVPCVHTELSSSSVEWVALLLLVTAFDAFFVAATNESPSSCCTFPLPSTSSFSSEMFLLRVIGLPLVAALADAGFTPVLDAAALVVLGGALETCVIFLGERGGALPFASVARVPRVARDCGGGGRSGPLSSLGTDCSLLALRAVFVVAFGAVAEFDGSTSFFARVAPLRVGLICSGSAVFWGLRVDLTARTFGSSCNSSSLPSSLTLRLDVASLRVVGFGAACTVFPRVAFGFEAALVVSSAPVLAPPLVDTMVAVG